jgi:hypothetical protein
VPSPTSEPFWEGCRLRELRYQFCTVCESAVFDPQPICRNCRAPELEWRVGSGEGVVYSWTIVWRPQMPAFRVPYAPAIIRLAEGYDMLSTLIGCDPEDISEGMSVAVEFHPIGDGYLLPYFAPASGRSSTTGR